MSTSPAVLAAFTAWKNAELAMHYATPCPDEVMDALGVIASDAFDALMALPVSFAADGLLKTFPLLIREFEPALGQPPMRPSRSRSYNYDAAFLSKLATDLSASHPALADAIASPHREHA